MSQLPQTHNQAEINSMTYALAFACTIALMIAIFATYYHHRNNPEFGLNIKNEIGRSQVK